MDSYYLSLLEGARGLRRERLPGGLGQAQLAAGGSNQGGGIVRNVCENRGWGGEFSGRACRKNQIFYLTALLRNLAGFLCFCWLKQEEDEEELTTVQKHSRFEGGVQHSGAVVFLPVYGQPVATSRRTRLEGDSGRARGDSRWWSCLGC